jgi:hypothetical protein
MASGKIATSKKYSPVEINAIVKQVQTAHGTQNNIMGRIWAVATILRESGGESGIWADDTNGKQSKGWWMFNGVTGTPDSVAYDPVAATEKAYATTQGFTTSGKSVSAWQPWVNGAQRAKAGNPDSYGDILRKGTSQGQGLFDQAVTSLTKTDFQTLDNTNHDLTSKALRDQLQGGNPIADWTDSNITDPVTGAASGVVDAATAVPNFLATVGAYLFNGSFWTRIGLGLAAVALIGFALFLTFRDDVANLPIPV